MKEIRKDRLWTGLSPWIIIGAVAILFPIFGFIAMENIHRQKEYTTRLLLEKGAALIRSFEAGTRMGIGMRGGNFQLQTLLSETARQPDIEYLMVVDEDGRIIAASDPQSIGAVHDASLDFKAIAHDGTVRWRVVTGSHGKQTFEVFRKFAPIGRPGRSMMMMHQWMRQPRGRPGAPEEWSPDESIPLSIIVGLDMTSIEAARKADMWHFLLMVLILLLIGFAGIILLLMFQSYRTTRASLSRIKAFSDTLVENMPIGLVAVDMEKRIASVNAAGGSILGIASAGVTGQFGGNILPAELWHQLVKLDAQERPVEQELDCTLHGGQIVPLQVSAAALTDEFGNMQGSILLFKDLSEIASLRAEIERSQRLATVGRLAAGVAHEIRNPLSSIKGFATYFKERYRKVPEDQHIAGIMIQEVDRLNRVVGQLLEFARPVSISKREISLRAFMEDSLKLVERQASDSGVSIQTVLPDEEAVGRLDPDKMNQVLLNLYLNAIESMVGAGAGAGANGGAGKGKMRVSLSNDDAYKRIEIRVSDTGTGISERDLAHIFDPYFTTKSTGTGLGLAIAHNIIQGHGGEIHAESRVGAGTTFTIVLPGNAESEAV